MKQNLVLTAVRAVVLGSLIVVVVSQLFVIQSLRRDLNMVRQWLIEERGVAAQANSNLTTKLDACIFDLIDRETWQEQKTEDK